MGSVHKRILDFVVGYIQAHGYPPTTREIADGVGYTSTATVFGYLREMREEGLIHYIDQCPRTITVPGYRYIKTEGRKDHGGTAKQRSGGKGTSGIKMV